MSRSEAAGLVEDLYRRKKNAHKDFCRVLKRFLNQNQK